MRPGAAASTTIRGRTTGTIISSHSAGDEDAAILQHVLMLIAFYVDNGKQLPVWKDLGHVIYWLLPLAVGIPLIVRVLSDDPS
jgi:hypothetical protein